MLCKWPRITSFFGIAEHIYSERTGNQKSTVFGTLGGVTCLNKEGSICLLTNKANEGKLYFAGADL